MRSSCRSFYFTSLFWSADSMFTPKEPVLDYYLDCFSYVIYMLQTRTYQNLWLIRVTKLVSQSWMNITLFYWWLLIHNHLELWTTHSNQSFLSLEVTHSRRHPSNPTIYWQIFCVDEDSFWNISSFLNKNYPCSFSRKLKYFSLREFCKNQNTW